MKARKKRMCKDGVTPFGRPPLAAGERRNKPVLVMLTARDYRAAKALAKAAGLPLATFLARAWKKEGD